jgi:hypothetical protein
MPGSADLVTERGGEPEDEAALDLRLDSVGIDNRAAIDRGRYPADRNLAMGVDLRLDDRRDIGAEHDLAGNPASSPREKRASPTRLLRSEIEAGEQSGLLREMGGASEEGLMPIPVVRSIRWRIDAVVGRKPRHDVVVDLGCFELEGPGARARRHKGERGYGRSPLGIRRDLEAPSGGGLPFPRSMLMMNAGIKRVKGAKLGYPHGFLASITHRCPPRGAAAAHGGTQLRNGCFSPAFAGVDAKKSMAASVDSGAAILPSPQFQRRRPGR